MSCLVNNFRQRKALNPHIWDPANVQQGSMNFTYALWIWQEPGICWIQNIINIILRHGSAADPVSHPSMRIRKPFHGEFELLPSERHYRLPLTKKKIYKCFVFFTQIQSMSWDRRLYTTRLNAPTDLCSFNVMFLFYLVDIFASMLF